MSSPANRNVKSSRRKITFGTVVKWIFAVLAAGWLFCVLLLVALKWIDPPTTAVQTERRVQAMLQGKDYEKRYNFVPLKQISPNLQHAVVSSEDARFYQHHGFDWKAIQLAAQEDMEGGRMRGGSTLTQQLVKNLFFGTSRSFVRKGAEASLVPMAELILGKQRILELYLNVVEWGPGVFGVDAACHYHYKTSAHSLDRDRAARLVSVLPSPLKRKPERMNNYSAIVLRRMRQVGW
ncbi:MAG: monofunctional biosynthetic peptidoglycan transglycosylase [Acidobacteriota bacterium]|nr:monofunctional biosynthetic peptidoglycan transglycosylase [Acidobacteriota bacterium]